MAKAFDKIQERIGDAITDNMVNSLMPQPPNSQTNDSNDDWNGYYGYGYGKGRSKGKGKGGGGGRAGGGGRGGSNRNLWCYWPPCGQWGHTQHDCPMYQAAVAAQQGYTVPTASATQGYCQPAPVPPANATATDASGADVAQELALMRKALEALKEKQAPAIDLRDDDALAKKVAKEIGSQLQPFADAIGNGFKQVATALNAHTPADPAKRRISFAPDEVVLGDDGAEADATELAQEISNEPEPDAEAPEAAEPAAAPKTPTVRPARKGSATAKRAAEAAQAKARKAQEEAARALEAAQAAAREAEEAAAHAAPASRKRARATSA